MEAAELAHLRRARDLLDREYARPLDVPAMALRRRGDMSLTDVCMAVGFTSLGSFSSTFTRLVGEPPSAYRARDHSRLTPVPPCMTFESLRAAGTEILQESVDQPYGVRDAAVRDPSGDHLRLSQPLAGQG